MEWSCRRVDGDRCVVRLQGELDEQAVEPFRAEMDRLLRDGGVRRLVLVMQRLSFVDSSGLGALLGRYKQAQALGVALCIAAPSRHVRALLELSGIPRLIPIYRSEQQALRAG